ncbi:TIGR02285 family protein [Bdellovibrio sp. NC01]|uniref:TIGR02285 family protein n=1 Tax=Bdellovibrio sp. NC01 TaxID=2220073 RepID=UPI001FEE5EBA|nr:TIGR02285 family protein [Bdellovibrio sp. NC01]
MKFVVHACCILFFSMAFYSAEGHAADNTKSRPVITWIRWDDPPIFINSGPFKGLGLLDNVEALVQKALPKYQHNRTDGTVPRVLKEAERKAEVCNAGWLDTAEWAKVFYFSKPFTVIPSNGVLLRESRLKDIRNLQPYSLQKFLDQKPNWKLGVGRLYGEGIDDVLIKNNYLKNPKIVTITTSLRVHQMIASDRIQYTLGYPFEAVYYNKLLDIQDSVIHIPLTDNRPFTNVVVACPKSPWGKKIIADVDKVLNNKELLEHISDGVDKWLTKEDRQRLGDPRRALMKKYYPNLL